VGDQLKTAAAGPYAPIIAVITALTGMLATGWQLYQGTQTTARVSYESLRSASEANTQAIEAVRLSQIEQAAWIQKLSDRLEVRQVASEKAIRKPKAAPLAPPKVEPAPPAPPPPEAPVPTRLLPFDALKAAP
jgi:hypothetical protein